MRLFGYFQNQYQQAGAPNAARERNSFALQQLNVFVQKDLARNWTALVNLEVLNTFSTSRQTGAMNLKEAWVRYRHGRGLNIRAGLQIPIFNHLNAIKDQTPVLPYVTRPLVYEESLEEVASLEEFIPDRAFLQVFGTLQPAKPLKVDYAFFIGNSPNIADLDDDGQSGVDTTNTLLFGARLGLRIQDLKAGVSITHDRSNRFRRVARVLEVPVDALTELPRIRVGVDVRYTVGPLTFEGEYIYVHYHERDHLLEINKEFYYGTLRWLIRDRLTLYGSFWVTREQNNIPPPPQAPQPPDGVFSFVLRNDAPSVGAAFNLSDRIVLKGQYARLERSNNTRFVARERSFNIYSVAVSVFF